MLTHEGENDYVLPKGKSCWITVDNISVYITNNAGVSGQCIEVYRRQNEDKKPLETLQLEPLQ